MIEEVTPSKLNSLLTSNQKQLVNRIKNDFKSSNNLSKVTSDVLSLFNALALDPFDISDVDVIVDNDTFTHEFADEFINTDKALVKNHEISSSEFNHDMFKQMRDDTFADYNLKVNHRKNSWLNHNDRLVPLTLADVKLSFKNVLKWVIANNYSSQVA